MEHGSVVEINYTAKVVDGAVFDTTLKKAAEQAGILDPNTKYVPSPIIVGAEELLGKLDDIIKEMKVGEQRKITIEAEDAYGMRNPELVVVVPLREFKKEKVQPFPGLIITVNNRRGRVQSVSGGRVRVDFNHPLAGKDIEYELKIEREIKDTKEKVQALFEKYFEPIPEKERSMTLKEQELEVAIDPKYDNAIAPMKKMFADLITKNIIGVKKVRFVSEFSKKEEKEGKTSEKTASKKEETAGKKNDAEKNASETKAGNLKKGKWIEA